MSPQLPAPEWAKPGATAYVRRQRNEYAAVTIVRLTPTQVVVSGRYDIEWRFSLKNGLREVGGDHWRPRRLVGPDDEQMQAEQAKEAALAARREAGNAARFQITKWIEGGDTDALRAAIRTLTEAVAE